MHDDRELVEARIGRLVRDRIRPALYARTHPLAVTAWAVPGEPVPVEQALAASYQPFSVGSVWGSPWSTTWFRLSGQVPADWAGRRVEAVFDNAPVSQQRRSAAEGLAYTADGTPIKGVSWPSRWIPVAAAAAGGEPVEFLVEAAANPAIHGVTELGDIETAPPEPLNRLVAADLAVLDEQVFGLLMDTEVLVELMEQLAVADPRRHEILRGLERMADTIDVHDVAGTAAAGRAELAELLARPASASAHTVAAVGHAHIDSAWLWPLRETHRKCARTFANMLELAGEYPEFVFACSQAQQYAWVKAEHPALYERIGKAVAAGSWVPVGSMWVESDGNLTGGEALARQLVFGKRFFATEFGVETKGIWLPDSFGYNAAFPQIAKLAGVDWFLSQKMSWNQTNKMPHHTFFWEGIDGSRIFTHFPPADTYNGRLSGKELAFSVANYAEKGAGTISLLPFGFGDGGGGPTREMVEKARRLADLEGSPKVQICAPDEFFARARAEYADAPVWRGEMYLELHRGTYTSQAEIKRGNRRSEHLLREAELWAATAAVAAGVAYPAEELAAIWRRVLLHQFHDILPGSSIAWVNREARAAYAQLAGELTELIERSAAALPGAAGVGRVLNAAPQDRAEVVAVAPAALGRQPAGQQLADGRIAAWAAAPALGVGSLAAGLPAGVTPVSADRHTLDNGLLRVRIDDGGNITSVFDLVAGREVLAPGALAGLLQIHPDTPTNWDAWDIDRHYLHRHVDLTAADTVELSAAGPLLGSVRVTRSVGASRIVQTVTLRAGARQLDFHTQVDWHETEHVLKAAFGVDVHAELEAAEIQFGHVTRPTHTNTSWDFARFELSHHRWVHVGEPGYGVAIANDATYGHDVSRTTRADGGTTTTVRLSLLRAPTSPDPRADIGSHELRYALVAGADIGAAVAAGYALNLPLRVVAGGGAAGGAGGTGAAAGTGTGAGSLDPIVTVDDPAATVEAVKLADDGSGDVIVRLYESRGGRAAGTVRPGFAAGTAGVVDLLERPLADPQPVPAGGLPIALRPFQILTLRFTRAG